MENLLSYKGYKGSIEFDKDDKIYHGKIQNIRGTILYESETLEELTISFREAVDDYIKTCEKMGTYPGPVVTS